MCLFASSQAMAGFSASPTICAIETYPLAIHSIQFGSAGPQGASQEAAGGEQDCRRAAAHHSGLLGLCRVCCCHATRALCFLSTVWIAMVCSLGSSSQCGADRLRRPAALSSSTDLFTQVCRIRQALLLHHSVLLCPTLFSISELLAAPAELKNPLISVLHYVPERSGTCFHFTVSFWLRVRNGKTLLFGTFKGS
jgi:hypothetical protein